MFQAKGGGSTARGQTVQQAVSNLRNSMPPVRTRILFTYEVVDATTKEVVERGTVYRPRQ